MVALGLAEGNPNPAPPVKVDKDLRGGPVPVNDRLDARQPKPPIDP